jgi:hypothetical protein
MSWLPAGSQEPARLWGEASYYFVKTLLGRFKAWFPPFELKNGLMKFN